MAKLNIYVTYDKDSESYNSHTFMAQNDKMARRIINDAMENDINFKRNAKKIILYKLGYYDIDEGTITANREELGNCKDFSKVPLSE